MGGFRKISPKIRRRGRPIIGFWNHGFERIRRFAIKHYERHRQGQGSPIFVGDEPHVQLKAVADMPGNGERLFDVATGKDFAIRDGHVKPCIMPGEETGVFVSPRRLDDHLLHHNNIVGGNLRRIRPSRGSNRHQDGKRKMTDGIRVQETLSVQRHRGQ
jgi:hypothetical protein